MNISTTWIHSMVCSINAFCRTEMFLYKRRMKTDKNLNYPTRAIALD